MHDTAYLVGGEFLRSYLPDGPCTVVEIGSLEVPSPWIAGLVSTGGRGSLRDFCRPDVSFIGLDLEPGPGVDLVIDPLRPLPLADGSADIVLSSSQMEHDPCFWETFLELARILRPGGFIYFNSPSNGRVHRYPCDYWRFYPDAGLALAAWAQRKGHIVKLIESFTAEREEDIWNDFVAIFQKQPFLNVDDIRPLSERVRCTNVRLLGMSRLLRERDEVEDAVIAGQLRTQFFERTGESIKLHLPSVPLVAPSSPNDIARETADLISAAALLRKELMVVRNSLRQEEAVAVQVEKKK